MMFCRLRRGFTKPIHQNWPKSFSGFFGCMRNPPSVGVCVEISPPTSVKISPLQEAFRNIVGRLLEAWQRECLEDWKFLPCGDVFRAYRQHTPKFIGTLNTWNRSSKRVERAWTCKYHICSGSSHRGAHAFNVVRFPWRFPFFSWLEFLHDKCQQAAVTKY